MIDKEKALKTFNIYVSKYNPEDEKIKLKIEHIQRVAKNANDIAKALWLVITENVKTIKRRYRSCMANRLIT